MSAQDTLSQPPISESMGTFKSAHKIPEVLKQFDQWVLWCAMRNPKDPDNPKKVPYQAANFSRFARTNDSKTWNSFEAAHASLNTNCSSLEEKSEREGAKGLFGLGFVLTQTDGLVGVDLDNACNPDTGEIYDWALRYIERLDSYTEYSPSRTGFHIYVLGDVPADGKRRGNHKTGGIEIYKDLRYLTVTGDKFDG